MPNFRATGISINSGAVQILQTAGDPNNVLTANPGSLALDSDGTAWVKTSGAGNTGWEHTVYTEGGSTLLMVEPDTTVAAVTAYLDSATSTFESIAVP